jgi:hypothetical protein
MKNERSQKVPVYGDLIKVGVFYGIGLTNFFWGEGFGDLLKWMGCQISRHLMAGCPISKDVIPFSSEQLKEKMATSTWKP